VTHELIWSAKSAMTALRARSAVITMAICFVLMCTASHHAYGKDRTMKLVVLGDSLTAGYRVPAADAFPTKLEQALRKAGQTVAVVNAGVSGDTAAMGLARLDRSVPAGAGAVILELGANDMLQGFKPSVTRASLAAILRRLEARNIVVLLCGVRTQPNLDDQDKRAFAAMFSGLAREHDVLFYPVFDGAFVDQPQLKLSDGLHPNAGGIDAVVADILPRVEALINRTRHLHR